MPIGLYYPFWDPGLVHTPFHALHDEVQKSLNRLAYVGPVGCARFKIRNPGKEAAEGIIPMACLGGARSPNNAWGRKGPPGDALLQRSRPSRQRQLSRSRFLLGLAMFCNCRDRRGHSGPQGVQPPTKTKARCEHTRPPTSGTHQASQKVPTAHKSSCWLKLVHLAGALKFLAGFGQTGNQFPGPLEAGE